MIYARNEEDTFAFNPWTLDTPKVNHYITYPNDRVELRHGDLLGSLDGGGDLLLVLLRQERQHLPHDGRQPLDDFGLK